MTTVSLSTDPKKHGVEPDRAAAGKRRRLIREALTGYLFVLPAALVTFVFGLWPVIAGFYESLKAGSPLTNRYVGLGNYVRSLGSLIYIVLFAASLAFLYVAYRSWRGAYLHRKAYGGNPWYYVIPGLLAGLGFTVVALNFVTGSEAYNWLPVVLFLLALAGFHLGEHLQSPRVERDPPDLIGSEISLLGIGLVWLAGLRSHWGTDLGLGGLGVVIWVALLAVLAMRVYLPRLGRMRAWQYIGTSVLMGTLMLSGILLARYTVSEMESDVREARQVAALIFNTEVLNAAPLLADENAQISGLKPDGEIMVTVVVGGETITAPLAPESVSELPAERITRVETALANNQKVKVILPDGSIAEGQITGLAMGEQQTIGLLAENPQSVREVEIYSALDVGENVIQAGGHTEPLHKQVYAALLFYTALATIYVMTWVRHQTDAEQKPRLYRWLHIGRILMGGVVVLALFYLVGAIELSRQAATGMGTLSPDQFARAYQFATGSAPRPTLRADHLTAQLLYWPQVFLVSAGAALIGAAYLVWRSAQQRETKLGFALTIMLALMMMVGGWLAISELPRTIGMAGNDARDTYDASVRTAMYAVGTVPVQLTLGLFLAYLLFSEVGRGKTLYRVIYFMPYIAPSVATSTVFLVIFSLNDRSLANQALGSLGIEPLTWLKEPMGIVRIFYEQVLGGNPLDVPAVLQGPSLALFTVILYNIWVFAGYNAVIFLAGLGAIPGELYEAAEVDGAGRWSRFRNITLPLLSPTTFFLTMLSIIGTFKAFTHIYVLRGQAAGKAVDTMSVHIFRQLYAANDPGYAAALAFTLFGMILILTFVQNRLTREQVFYG